MKNRVLLKEIPKGKFHSAIFTTFSINLYYLEQQVLPLLGSKGIHYVSILADGVMLSSQLENYAQLSQQRKRNYAIHGIQSKGAFHPKMILLAGPDSILLLVGSGNLTTSGHGKNLETWNAIYINSLDDAKYGFVMQAWNYLKQLHADLGESASNKLKSIEENCSLMSSGKAFGEQSFFDFDEKTQISFHANQGDNSLFRQVSKIIEGDKISRITIMTPFHDTEGKFIQELNKLYNPNQINVLVQTYFGSLPKKMSIQSNVSFFDWESVMQKENKQSYFHSKNIVLEGKNKNYLISGSANASIAAFGTLSIPATNHESCVIYQSSQLNFLDLLSIKINSAPVNLKDYESEINQKLPELSETGSAIFIKSAEKDLETVNLIFHVKTPIKGAIIQLFDPNGSIQFEEIISFGLGNHFHQISIAHGIDLMFAQVTIQNIAASNKQFITDINAFESTNPSPRNRSLNQIRKLIESGSFSTPKIIDYLNTLYQQKEVKKGITKSSIQKESSDEMPKEEDNYLLYLSYAEIQERAKQIGNQEKDHHYVEYKGVRIWESIFSYLKESREKELQTKIDEEETEDVNNSEGRPEKKQSKLNRPISKSTFEKLERKVTNFLDSYNEILKQKTDDSKSEQPTLIDLSMYLIMLEILLHLIEHRELVAEKNEKKHLLQINLSNERSSWSDYLLQFIGRFTMWCNQKNGFKDIDSTDYRLKLERYRSMAFKTSVCALSIYNIVNKRYDKQLQNQWLSLSLLNSDLAFNSPNTIQSEIEEFISLIPKDVLSDLKEEVIEDEISRYLFEIKTFLVRTKEYSAGDFFHHPEIGFTFLDKLIESPNNTFYKLFTPGFEWNELVNNFWDGDVYSIKDNKWLKILKH